jgi:hypothetical protein
LNQEYRVITPLDPSEGGRYVKPVMENFITEDINQLYRTTTREEDYVNPTKDGMMSLKSISSCASDSGRGLENWQ